MSCLGSVAAERGMVGNQRMDGWKHLIGLMNHWLRFSDSELGIVLHKVWLNRCGAERMGS